MVNVSAPAGLAPVLLDGARRAPDERAVWAALAGVPDPELPILSVVDLGVVGDVRIEGRRCYVEFTPTVMSCPASSVMTTNIARAIEALGLEADVQTKHAPAWDSTRLSDNAHAKLRSLGISTTRVPKSDGKPGSRLRILDQMSVECPFCGSADTALENAFGGTCCRALRHCRSCRQPFQHFRLS